LMSTAKVSVFIVTLVYLSTGSAASSRAQS
jgi:hypothetical protein